MKKILLMPLLAGTLLVAASSKLDEKSGLVWQDNEAVSKVTKRYTDAKAYCRKLDVDGFHDWRLPTILEVYTIVDLSRDRPALKSGFQMRETGRFWTAIPFAGDPKREAWQVSMSYGEVEPVRQDRTLHVRCVRGGK